MFGSQASRNDVCGAYGANTRLFPLVSLLSLSLFFLMVFTGVSSSVDLFRHRYPWNSVEFGGTLFVSARLIGILWEMSRCPMDFYCRGCRDMFMLLLVKFVWEILSPDLLRFFDQLVFAVID